MVCYPMKQNLEKILLSFIPLVDVELRAASHTPQLIVGNTGLILGLRPANGRRRYKVTPSLIGWAQT